jgi:hypothetical protein
MKTTRTGPFLALLAALAVAGGLTAPGALAQAVNDAAREAIIGSKVTEEQVDAAADPERVIAAIEKTPDNISTVRKTTNLDTVDIVFLPDAAITEGGPPREIAAKVEERKDEIAELRQELEGNAMLYHAIDSRQVLMRDVLAVEFEDARVVIYAAAKPAGG